MSSVAFTDGRFMSKAEKEKTFKAMERFVKSKFKEGNFTKACYQILHLRFGFIAHYNKEQFYEIRFEEELRETLHRIRQFQLYPALREQNEADICLAIKDLFKDHYV